MTGEQLESVFIVEKENMIDVKTKPILIMESKPVDVSVINQPILAKRCKGMGYEHYILPAYKGVHINEILGYCSPCWIRQLVADNYGPTSQNVHKTKSYSDSKINPRSGSCSNDTL